MSVEADRDDLAHHADEMEAREGFNFAILDADETELFGCVYIYPPGAEGRRRRCLLVGRRLQARRPISSQRSTQHCPAGWTEAWGFARPCAAMTSP